MDDNTNPLRTTPSLPPRSGGVGDRGLSEADLKAQAERCPCKGANDMCVCQNAPDATTRKEWGLREPIPSGRQDKPCGRWACNIHTPWKRDGEDWINAHANEVTALDEARAYSATITPLVPLSTLTAQAAALVAAERERDEARTSMAEAYERAGKWQARAEAAESKAATLKARIAELEEGLEPFAKEADVIEQSYTMPLPDEYIPPFAPKLGLFRRARRLTHQEKNNAG